MTDLGASVSRFGDFKVNKRESLKNSKGKGLLCQNGSVAKGFLEKGLVGHKGSDGVRSKTGSSKGFETSGVLGQVVTYAEGKVWVGAEEQQLLGLAFAGTGPSLAIGLLFEISGPQ
ncbi:hypothetical protein GOBAR_AA38235 [Gossypium barbadense]|uniref:Uncharacterized protein n=1 Tax=Gossypium barbadense TaxID=3634 RepID=A0A2P5VUI9_GOSBA|nr:hypothetical protein GOBAR_AA38235 [Gossypium barbadense]